MATAAFRGNLRHKGPGSGFPSSPVMYGDDVERWQTVLIYGFGYAGVMSDSGARFGYWTDQATKAFQATHGRPVTGVVDQATWNAAGA
jgi:peptidoglycan hydrolase-like protein with peptidoglycan-binding domain